MKNLKKVLSLTLAMSMALSLMATAFAADNKDYADYDRVSYREAVDVMSAIGVFQGNKGSFDPTGSLTREQAAKIVTYLLMGQKKADKLTAAAAPYADVKADRWSAGAIAYCTNEGILAGTGNGTFNPTGKLTGLEFSKMLLAALGYNAEIEKLVGSAWGINASKLAINTGLDKNMESVALTDVLTREQAAQMAFNTLQATLVQYENKGTDINMGDISINVGASKAAEIADKGDARATIREDGLLQFAEKHFPKLTVSATTGDSFGRPARAWDYDSESDISVSADTAKFIYTAKVSTDDMKKNLKNYTYGKKGADLVVNTLVSKEARPLVDSAKAVADLTGNGITVEIFTDKKVITDIVVIAPVFQEAAVKNFKANKEHGAYTRYTVAGVAKNDFTTVVDADKDKDTAFVTGKVADGDKVLAYPDRKGNLYITAANTVSGVVSRVSAKDGTTTLTVDKKTYQMADVTGAEKPAVQKDSKTLYTDAFGYVLGAVNEETEAAKTILVTDKYTTLVDSRLVDQVSGIAGSGETIKLNVSRHADVTAGNVYTYEEDKATDDKGDYKFTALANGSKAGITKSTKTLNKAYFDANVKFVFAGSAFGSSVRAKDVAVRDGLQEVREGVQMYLATREADGTTYITTVYVGGKVAGGTVTSSDILYIAEKTGTENVLIDDKSKTVNVYEAYIRGEKTAVASEDAVEPGFYKSEKSAANGLYTLKGNAYSEDSGKNAVAKITVKSEVSSIINGTLDIRKAVVTDLTKNGDGVVKGKVLAVIYDADTNNAAYVYVTDAAVDAGDHK